MGRKPEVALLFAIGCLYGLFAGDRVLILQDSVATAQTRGSISGSVISDFITLDDYPAAAAFADDSGANFRILLPPTARKSSLLGRPSTFSISKGYRPFENMILTGFFSRPSHFISGLLRLPSRPVQIIAGEKYSHVVACVLAANDQSPASPDIFFFNESSRDRPKNDAFFRLVGHSVRPWRMLISSSNELVSVSDDGSIRLWDLNERKGAPHRDQNGRFTSRNDNFSKEIARFPGYPSDENGVKTRGEFAAFSPHGHWLATAYKKTVSLRSPDDGVEKFSFEPLAAALGKSQRVMAIRFSPHGNKLLAFFEGIDDTEDNRFKFLVYDIDAQKQDQFVGKHGVVDGRATLYEDYVITWDDSPDIVFWDMATHKEAFTLKVAPKNVYDVAFSPTGDVMATAGDDSEVKFWNIADRKQVQTKSPYEHRRVDLVQFSSDGTRMVTGSDDGWLKVWDAPECFWDRRGGMEMNRHNTIMTEKYQDGTVVVTNDDEHSVEETWPDGTVKKYKEQ